ncbi:MAG TPA: helix-turn-helix transcriptional regulator [Bacteroidales bacterium]|nr:helix-turn-helix transcriptional regulator [Bacteroidales bacterium]
MTKKEKIEKFLETVAEDDGSWLKEAQYRKENRYWLRKSQRIAIRVLTTLRERGMQQKELAERMGVSPQQISKIVKGNENLTLQTISKLEQILGITLFEIPEYKTEMEVPIQRNKILEYTSVEGANFKTRMVWSRVKKQTWKKPTKREELYSKTG